MGRRADSEELRSTKRAMTQEFIYAVENGGTLNGPKIIETDLGIGDKSGNVWCMYRRGARSWPIPALRQFIVRAKACGYISEMKASELISKLPSDDTPPAEQPTDELYTFNATRMFYLDIEQTAELLVKQVRALQLRISCGNEELNNAHYYNTSLDLLEPVQSLIHDLIHQNRLENIRLKNEFGIENPKDIPASSASISASAWDVGYTPDWWMRSPPSKEEVEAIRLAIAAKTEKHIRANRKRSGSDTR